MVKKRLIILVAAIAVCMILFGCEAQEEKPYDTAFPEAVDFYTEFLETGLVDWNKAVREYCHSNDQGNLDEEKIDCEILSYEIIRFEKLSDQLWVVETFTTAKYNPKGAYGVNYIAIIDGQHYVIRNIRNIPEELTEGIEIEPYVPHGPGIVSPEDIWS